MQQFQSKAMKLILLYETLCNCENVFERILVFYERKTLVSAMSVRTVIVLALPDIG